MGSVLEVADTLIKAGVSVIPVKKDKTPMGAWASFQKKLPSMEDFTKKYKEGNGIAAICGKVSGGLECLDFDLKYSDDETFFKDFCGKLRYIEDLDVKSLYIAKTPSGGRHIAYRCSVIEGNLKLASRKDGDDTLCFLETRGEGGYFLTAPSTGYEVIQGGLDDLLEISPVVRKDIMDLAKSYNRVKEEEVTKLYDNENNPKKSLLDKEVKTIWDVFNKTHDIITILKEHGYTVPKEDADKIYILRPNSTSEHSGYLYKDSNYFFIWSSNMHPLKPRTCYSPSSLLIDLIYKGVPRQAYKKLLDFGYKDPKVESKGEFTVPLNGVNNTANTFIISKDVLYQDVLDMVHGDVVLGLSTGIPTLDEHFRFKKPNLVIILGRDNVGKSLVTWYLSFMSAMIHNWRWVIVCFENKPKYVYRKMIEFYWCKSIEKISDREFEEAFDFVSQRITILDVSQVNTHKQILSVIDEIRITRHIDALMIDPMNSLDQSGSGIYDFVKGFVNYIGQWKNKNNVSVYVNAHAVTSANRVSADGGIPLPPSKYDIEGGSKLPGGADEFLIIHRDIQSEVRWNINEIHVAKVKETETGGKPTYRDSPVMLKVTRDLSGFETYSETEPAKSGYNPVLEYHKMNGRQISVPVVVSPPMNPDANISGLLAIKQEVDTTNFWYNNDDKDEDAPF